MSWTPAPVEISIGTLAMDLPALGGGDEDDAGGLRVIPVLPPAVEGLIATLDGRALTYPEGGPAELVRRLERRQVAVRIDLDHMTEPSNWRSPGTTEAHGWVVRFALTPQGGIEAHADIFPETLALIESRRYRYVSPAVEHLRREVLGISSIALTNRPALGRSAHLSQQETRMSDTTKSELDALQQQLDEQKRANAELLTKAAAAEIDAAVAAGRVTEGERESLLALATAHRDGLGAGLEALRAALAARPAPPAPGQLDRLNLDKKPGDGDGDAAPSTHLPAGFVEDPEMAKTHKRILAHAAAHNVSYQTALLHIGSLRVTEGGP